jgi:hypothetical protein
MRPVRAGRSHTHLPLPVLAVPTGNPSVGTAEFGSATFSSELETCRARNAWQSDTTVGVWSATVGGAANPRVTRRQRGDGPRISGSMRDAAGEASVGRPDDAIEMGSS